jgi:hypothetical protein
MPPTTVGPATCATPARVSATSRRVEPAHATATRTARPVAVSTVDARRTGRTVRPPTQWPQGRARPAPTAMAMHASRRRAPVSSLVMYAPPTQTARLRPVRHRLATAERAPARPVTIVVAARPATAALAQGLSPRACAANQCETEKPP